MPKFAGAEHVAASVHPDCGILRAVPFRLPVYCAFTLLAVVTNYFLGKEVGWDVLSYHLYAGLNAVSDRFDQDYFAAGPQSYFNPYAFVPFYLLVKTGLPSLLIASILAAAQSMILWLTFELGVSVCPSQNTRLRLAVGVSAAALAFVNPILMQQLGSSFTDITTGAVVLAGWLFLVGTVRGPSAARTICAGLILGGATALKLTNAVHAIAGLAVLIMLPLSTSGRIRHWVYFGISLGLGFAIVAAPWAIRLEHMFGNPLFPLLNGVFRSPEFTTEPIRHFRFTPDTLVEALWRPFQMIDPMNMVQEELRAPDLRYAALLVLVAALFSRWMWQRFAERAVREPYAHLAGPTRVLAALGCGLAADWVLWLSGSGNGRYFLPAACVAGVVFLGLLFTAFAAQPKARNYIIIIIFGVQAIQLWMGTDFRWHEESWGGPWFDVAVPAKLRTEPNLFLAMGGQTNSFIVPYLAKGSGFINISGAYVLGPEGASGARIKTLESRYAQRLRVILYGDELHEDSDRRSPRRSQVDTTLSPFGLRVDMGDCETITVNGLQPEFAFAVDDEKRSIPIAHDKRFFVSCRLIPSDTDNSARFARQQSVDLVLNRLEDACPKLFQPRRPLTEYNGRQWSRHYTNTDINAWISGGELKFSQPDRGAELVHVGHEIDWIKAPLRLACGRRDNIYYAKVLGTKQAP